MYLVQAWIRHGSPPSDRLGDDLRPVAGLGWVIGRCSKHKEGDGTGRRESTRSKTSWERAEAYRVVQFVEPEPLPMAGSPDIPKVRWNHKQSGPGYSSCGKTHKCCVSGLDESSSSSDV